MSLAAEVVEFRRERVAKRPRRNSTTSAMKAQDSSTGWTNVNQANLRRRRLELRASRPGASSDFAQRLEGEAGEEVALGDAAEGVAVPAAGSLDGERGQVLGG